VIDPLYKTSQSSKSARLFFNRPKKNISMDPVHAKRNPWLIKPQKVGLLQILYMTLVRNHDQHACTKSTATLKLQNQTNLER
jgi:hypothetical protein